MSDSNYNFGHRKQHSAEQMRRERIIRKNRHIFRDCERQLWSTFYEEKLVSSDVLKQEIIDAMRKVHEAREEMENVLKKHV